jgi:hypothetical protein
VAALSPERTALEGEAVVRREQDNARPEYLEESFRLRAKGRYRPTDGCVTDIQVDAQRFFLL